MQDWRHCWNSGRPFQDANRECYDRTGVSGTSSAKSLSVGESLSRCLLGSRYAGFTIPTDPNFLHSADHVHLGYGITSERKTDPAIEIEELPENIDFILLSHYHGDHFDRIVEEKLDQSLPIVTTQHAADELAE